MNPIKLRDVKLGSESERFMLPVIKQILKLDTLVQSKNPYSTFDYYAPNYAVELKTRFCPSNQYVTTMIPLSKVLKCIDPNINYWFFFRFSDGVSYIKYNKDLFATFEKNKGGRCDRGHLESNDYVYIPLKKCIHQPI